MKDTLYGNCEVLWQILRRWEGQMDEDTLRLISGALKLANHAVKVWDAQRPHVPSDVQ
jgi:hypothetical protein